MAILTPLSLPAARALGRAFGLDVAAVVGIPQGSVNSNFAFELDSGAKTFCRVYEEQTPETAAGEARLLAHLAALGIPTPEPLRRADGGGFITLFAGKPVALFPWIDGQMRCQASVTERDAEIVGGMLARIHEAGASFDDRAQREGASPLPESRFDPTALVRRLDELRLEGIAPGLRREIEDVAARARDFLTAKERAAGRAGPLGLIHGDLFRDNVLWVGPSISAVLDFESASRGSQAFDLMVLVLAWCFGDALDPALVRSVLRGYRAGRQSTGEQARGPELTAESLFEQGRLAAVRFTVTRITDFELRLVGNGAPVGVHKDFRRFVARWEALEALGKASLEAMLAGA